jgi:hypothetical protein
MNVPDHLASALAAVDEAVHANEHTQRPDWALDKSVRTVQIGNGAGVLDIHSGACRYCLADQAHTFGLTRALEDYLNTPAPPPPPRPTPEQLEARRRAEAEHEATMHDPYLSIEEYQAMSHTQRAVYDLIDNECGGHHANTPGLIDRLIAAVVRGRIEDAITDVTRADAAEREALREGPIVDIPLFTVEGESP